MATNKEQLKAYFETGDTPTEAQFKELIDSSINTLDDKASLAEAEEGTNDEKYVTPKGVKSAVEVHAPVKSINGYTGDVVLGLGGDDSGWTEPSLENGFLNFSTVWYEAVRYRKKNGVVYIEGLIKEGAANGVLFTLPPEFRPSKSMMFSNICYTGTYTVGRVDISANGNVVIITVGDFTNLSGISFLVD